MLKMFSGSNRQKKKKKQQADEERSTSSFNLDWIGMLFFRGLAGPLSTNLNFQKFSSLDFKSG